MLRQRATRLFSSSIKYMGEEGFEFRAYYFFDDDKKSPWHDIALKPNKELDYFNAFYEIPRNTTAKMEVATDERYNPIKQDVKVDKKTGEAYLRHYMLNPCFNYGMIP